MIATLHGVLEGVRTAEYRNKNTKEKTPIKLFANLSIDDMAKDGKSIKKRLDIKIDEKLADELKDRLGEPVDIKCNISTSDRIVIEAI